MKAKFRPTLTLRALRNWPLQDIVYFEPFVNESSILLWPSPTCIARTIAILLHVYCAIYDSPDPSLVCHTPYDIGNGNIVQTPTQDTHTTTIKPPKHTDEDTHKHTNAHAQQGATCLVAVVRKTPTNTHINTRHTRSTTSHPFGGRC